MELKTAQITSNQIVCHSDTQITLENDMNVPDSKPDIDKIIKIEGNILSNSVVALDGRAGIKGVSAYNELVHCLPNFLFMTEYQIKLTQNIILVVKYIKKQKDCFLNIRCCK